MERIRFRAWTDRRQPLSLLKRRFCWLIAGRQSGRQPEPYPSSHAWLMPGRAPFIFAYPRSKLATALAIALASLGLSLLRAADAPQRKTEDLPTAGEIIRKALDQAERAEEQGFEARLRCTHVNVKEYLDREGETKSREEVLYSVYPVDGHSYYERIEQDGKPLTETQLQKEQERKREFREEISQPKPKDKKKKDDNQIKFNEELVRRYRADVVGREKVNGRSAYVLRFEPKSGKLPVQRRIDRPLNHSNGKLWIDEEDFAVVRVEFQLIEPVTLWWGLLGKVSAMEGRLEQVRLEPGVWYPLGLKLYIKGRVLFQSLHQRQTLVWRDFEMSPPVVAEKQ